MIALLGRRLKLFALVLLLLASTSLWAHQQKYAITTVAYNPSTGNLEVMHRLSAHDGEHLVKQLIDPRADLLNDTATQAAFARYIRENFSLALDGVTSELSTVGEELDGKFFWVYQEVKLQRKPQSMTIQYDALQEIWPKQTNLVNVEGFGPLRSVEFRKDGPTMQTIQFD